MSQYVTYFPKHPSLSLCHVTCIRILLTGKIDRSIYHIVHCLNKLLKCIILPLVFVTSFQDLLRVFVTRSAAISAQEQRYFSTVVRDTGSFTIITDAKDSRKAARETSGDKEVTWQSKKETWRINWKRARARTRVGLRSCE